MEKSDAILLAAIKQAKAEIAQIKSQLDAAQCCINHNKLYEWTTISARISHNNHHSLCPFLHSPQINLEWVSDIDLWIEIKSKKGLEYGK